MENVEMIVNPSGKSSRTIVNDSMPSSSWSANRNKGKFWYHSYFTMDGILWYVSSPLPSPSICSQW